MIMNLQYFGGRGGAGGKRSESNTTYREAISKTKVGAASIKTGDAIRTIKASAEKVALSGTYVQDGEEYDISYTRSRAYGGVPTLQQNVDGHPYGGHIILNQTAGSKTYTAVNENDERRETNSLNAASNWAFKLPRGWRKKGTPGPTKRKRVL